MPIDEIALSSSGNCKIMEPIALICLFAGALTFVSIVQAVFDGDK